MKNKTPDLAASLFNTTHTNPEVVQAFAEGIVEIMVLKAKVWGVVSAWNFIALVVAPLWLGVAADPRFLWLLIPGTFLGFLLAATAPKGVAP